MVELSRLPSCMDVSENVQELLLLDIIPLSLGIETAIRVTAVLIKCSTAFPIKAVSDFTTYSSNWAGVLLQVYEGEKAMTNLLWVFKRL